MSNTTRSSRVTIGRIGTTPQITDPWSSGLEKQRPSRCGGPKSLAEPTYRKIGRRKMMLHMRVHDPGTTVTQRAKETATAKLNRIYLCTFNRMAQSCIYFVLFLVILSPNTSCALRSSAGETQNYVGILSNDSATTTYDVSSLHSSRRTNPPSSSSSSSSNVDVDYRNDRELHKVDLVGLGGERAGQAETISGGKYDYNYENTHTNASAKDEIVDQLERQSNSLDFDGVDMFGAFSIPEEAIYTNEFAVNIPAGKQMADVIATKHGFINRGQVRMFVQRCNGIGAHTIYLIFHRLDRWTTTICFSITMYRSVRCAPVANIRAPLNQRTRCVLSKKVSSWSRDFNHDCLAGEMDAATAREGAPKEGRPVPGLTHLQSV